MDRREFLKALAACGAALAMPAPIESANAAQVDAIWSTLVKNPWHFEVGEFGTIVEPNVPVPKTRADVFDVWSHPRTADHIISEIHGTGPLRNLFEGLAADEVDELQHRLGDVGDADPDQQRQLERLLSELDGSDGWEALVRREGGLERCWKIVDEWLGEPVDWDELEWFPPDWHGQGVALKFFRDTVDVDVLDELGVVIVEGDHPGSTYFAAELRNDIAAANATAARLALPFRFQPAGGVA